MPSKSDLIRQQIARAVASGKTVLHATPDGWRQHSPESPEGVPCDPPPIDAFAPVDYGDVQVFDWTGAAEGEG